MTSTIKRPNSSTSPDVVIRVENLYKEYRLGTISHGTLYKDLQSWWARMRGKEDPNSIISASQSFHFHHPASTDSENPHFLALKDVSFEVKRGEVLGIIGRNGAGKSTLLKILSEVTSPTKGTVKIKGRVASLLEVGTGFHPELTGRENIYLNGAILGMTKKEIYLKFDEIVDFAELDKFIDTPVKRYSSGMYVRLAFAVAAHLEPEILIVDEVLAVGDLAFQKKCLGKMEEVAQGGRTVLFVSHNMQAIRNLCPRSLLLDKGEIIHDAETDAVMHNYNLMLRDINVDNNTSISDPVHRRGSGAVRFTALSVQDINGNERFQFKMDDTIRFKLKYKIYKDLEDLFVSVALRSGITNEIVTSVRHLISSEAVKAGTQGSVMIQFPDICIRPGEYPLYFWLGDKMGRPFDVVDNITAPLVISTEDEPKDSSFNPLMPVGYFSMSTTITK
ncbi:MAG: ABC-type polysaccharide/polyol phosphate transport system, ATPase component, partial [Nitrospirae bacterium]|nr:ABC-type polysaccharide/polyol phosphate transport system, ATPase component [Nitrospirota bacterium]